MSYMKAEFHDKMDTMEKKTGYDASTLAEKWWELSDECGAPWEHFVGMGDLAQDTGYDFVFLVGMYCQCHADAEHDGEPFDWEGFCATTRELDWFDGVVCK